jgi:hypothetical protein
MEMRIVAPPAVGRPGKTDQPWDFSTDRFAGLPTPTSLGLASAAVGMEGSRLGPVRTRKSTLRFSNSGGFGDDQDSWTIDIRYSHADFVGNCIPNGNNISVSDGTIVSSHQPRRFGLGAIDYSTADASDVTRPKVLNRDSSSSPASTFPAHRRFEPGYPGRPGRFILRSVRHRAQGHDRTGTRTRL